MEYNVYKWINRYKYIGIDIITIYIGDLNNSKTESHKLCTTHVQL